ncbi:MAG: hypothetical protein CVT94_02035 [Bacteroidetes bacterium HGW-Bacteroidetes-11]|nr:MAG: hypothetical protein CVT94_02035 [Bacteroidetes bacterium HGW-Bacteroidetes-11]
MLRIAKNATLKISNQYPCCNSVFKQFKNNLVKLQNILAQACLSMSKLPRIAQMTQNFTLNSFFLLQFKKSSCFNVFDHKINLNDLGAILFTKFA